MNKHQCLKRLYQIAIKNKFNVEKLNSFDEALKKISSKKKSLLFALVHFIMLEIF